MSQQVKVYRALEFHRGATTPIQFKVAGSTYEAGVKIASITNIGGSNASVTPTASGLIKVDVDGTLYYIPLYAAGDLAGE